MNHHNIPKDFNYWHRQTNYYLVPMCFMKTRVNMYTLFFSGNYLDQGVERIVDQVVNPKVTAVFIPKVEDLVYNYFGIARAKNDATSDKNDTDVITDHNDASPGTIKNYYDKPEEIKVVDNGEIKMEVEGEDTNTTYKTYNNTIQVFEMVDRLSDNNQETPVSEIRQLTIHDQDIIIPLPSEDIKLESIPAPTNTPPEVDLETMELNICPVDDSMDIPLPDDEPDKEANEDEYHFKPIGSDDDESESSDSSLRRNVSPLTPIRNYNNENSCDAQQGFENSSSSDTKPEDKKTSLNSFRFTIESKDSENMKSIDKKEPSSSYKRNNSITTFSTPLLQPYEDSSNSNNLQIDYESDNTKFNNDSKMALSDQNSESVPDAKMKDAKSDDKKSSHKSARSSRDRLRDNSHSSKERRSDSKQSNSRDRKDCRHDKRSSKDDGSKSKSRHRDSSKETDKKENRDSSKRKHSSSHKSSSSQRDGKSHRTSSSSHRHSSSSSKPTDDKKTSSNREKNDKQSDSRNSKETKSSRDSSRHASSNRSDKDGKSSSCKSKHSDEKERDRKDKKSGDDHYSAAGKGNHRRRSTDRDSNDGNSSSSNIQPSSNKPTDSKRETTSKSENTYSSSDTAGQSDRVELVNETELINENKVTQAKPVVRVETHLETPICEPPHLLFTPDVTMKKPKFAANFEEARELMKLRKHLEAEQLRKNQEAALLLEFQQNVRPSLSQVYSSVPGPELEFVCYSTNQETQAQHSFLAESYPRAIHNDVEYLMENVNNEAIEENNANIMFNNSVQTAGNYGKCSVADDMHADIETAMQEMHAESKIGCNDYNEDVVEQRPNIIQAVDVTGNKNIAEYCKDTVTGPISENKEELQCTDSVDNKIETVNESNENIVDTQEDKSNTNVTLEEENDFKYFNELEQSSALLDCEDFTEFLDSIYKNSALNKLTLVDCDMRVTNLIAEAAKEFGDFEISTYNRNGLNKHAIKNVKVMCKEVSIPLQRHVEEKPNVTTACSSRCTPESSNSSLNGATMSSSEFETSDYDAKIKAMVQTTSRQEIMEIILGGIMEDCPDDKMPKVDICSDAIISDNEVSATNLKRNLSCVEADNNNKDILCPTKIRKTSENDHNISSTTEGIFFLQLFTNLTEMIFVLYFFLCIIIYY